MVPDLPKDADQRWNQQLAFLLETDQLKHVLSTTLLPAGRRENAAEHSWHLAMLAPLLAQYADQKLDVQRLVQMVLMHNLVKIDTDDLLLFEEESLKRLATRRQLAAERIFGLLPLDEAADFHRLWDEFTAQTTPEARFAIALDRFLSILLNYASRGEMWRQYGLTAARLLADNSSMAAISARLWQYTQTLIAEAVRRNYLPA